MSLSARQRALLLDVARESIEHGLERNEALPVRAADYDEDLRRPSASFVTLEIAARLRGCIGSLRARRPLVCDVAHQAFGAAFSDPRFPAVSRPELPRLRIQVSVLAPAVPLIFADESELLRQLRPGIDGLTIDQDPYHATFLPAVWETLPAPRDFLDHLKRKAGMRPDQPVASAERYTAESFGE